MLHAVSAEFVALVVLGYLLGSCPWGYWLVRAFRNEDVRQVGSGNIGISNVWRTYGWTLGLPLVALDFGKGFVPALLGVHYVSTTAGLAAGAAAMIGHARPLFLGFERGGKMIATGGGAMFAVAPLAAATGLVIWLVIFVLLGYASVASLSTAVCFPFLTWTYGYPKVVTAFAAIALVVVLYLHRANVGRLWRGREHRSRIAVLPRLRLQR
jgi:glycerol-3-phosphate acyltransferase PlsY